MKIIKTENKSKSVDVYKNGFSGVVKSLKKNGKRNLIVACSLLLIGGAVWLNWALFSKADGADYDPKTTTSGKVNGADKPTLGGNVSTDGSTDSYFAMAQIDRTRARDEALEVLYQITSSDDATEEAKDSAYASITKLSEQIEKEANIEALVKSKGVSECVAVLDGDKANIILSVKDGLTDSLNAQVVEIVYEQAGIVPENMTIIEKSAG